MVSILWSWFFRLGLGLDSKILDSARLGLKTFRLGSARTRKFRTRSNPSCVTRDPAFNQLSSWSWTFFTFFSRSWRWTCSGGPGGPGEVGKVEVGGRGEVGLVLLAVAFCFRKFEKVKMRHFLDISLFSFLAQIDSLAKLAQIGKKNWKRLHDIIYT